MRLRDKILAANDIKSEPLHVDAWDVDVIVRGLTGEQRARSMKGALDGDEKTDETRLAVAVVIEGTLDPETSEPAFQPADRDILLTKSVGAIEQLAKKILQLSGLMKESGEEIRKNSGAASVDSISVSPNPLGAPLPNSSSESVAPS